MIEGEATCAAQDCSPTCLQYETPSQIAAAAGSRCSDVYLGVHCQPSPAQSSRLGHIVIAVRCSVLCS